MKLKEINFMDAGADLQRKNIIYGAGHNGKIVKQLLDDIGVPVEAFYDDDVTRWGEKYCGKMILSREQFHALDRNIDNIIISSMYTEKIADKIAADGFKNVYTVLDQMLDVTSGHLNFSGYCGNRMYLEQLDTLIDLSEDDKTKQYYTVIRESVRKGRPGKEIADLYCREDQYLLNCFYRKLEGVNIMDGGAYTGDTVREILGKNIHPEKIYCFEADRDNYNKLQKYVKENDGLKNSICRCENFALWDHCIKTGTRRSGYNVCIDPSSKNAIVQTMTMDQYFQDIKIGFVKMDIEGAEKRALAGGMKVLKRDRPFLAISIYHSLDDIIEIPQMLIQQLPAYHFIVRSHSSTYSEAILYGVPDESEVQLG